MPRTIPDSARAIRQQKLSDVAPQPAKAALREQAPASADGGPQPSGSELRIVAGEALRRVTSQKAAALDIGITEGRLSHKMRDGSLTLAQLEALGPRYAAELGRSLVEQYEAAIETPRERARRVLPALIREFMEAVA